MSIVLRNALSPGVRVNYYQILEVLGSGGFGITYRVKHISKGKEFALKEFMPNQIAVRSGEFDVIPKSREFEKHYKYGINRFLKEAAILAKFNHLNIVKVFDLFKSNRTAYFLMEYVQGQDLNQYLLQEKLMSEQKLLSIVLPLLEALKTIHRKKLYHRDIKPDNIYLAQNRVPVLIDFGAARFDYVVASHSLTVILTEGYAPFEQYQTGKKQGPWTDLYALGAVMYKCLFGIIPPAALIRVQSIQETDIDPYIPAIECGRSLFSKPLLQALDWALQINIEHRPQNAAVFQRFLGDNISA